MFLYSYSFDCCSVNLQTVDFVQFALAIFMEVLSHSVGLHGF